MKMISQLPGRVPVMNDPAEIRPIGAKVTDSEQEARLILSNILIQSGTPS